MVLEIFQQWQSTDVGFRMAALASVVAAYGLFELALGKPSLRKSRAP